MENGGRGKAGTKRKQPRHETEYENQREAFWIHRLDAFKYPGLNEDIDLLLL